MKIFDVTEEGRLVTIQRNRAGRAAAAAARFAITLPIASGLLFGYFMLDVLGPRPIDSERLFGFVVSALGIGLIFAVALGLAAAMRISIWRIDAGSGTIGYETRLAAGEPRGVDVDLSNLSEVLVERRGRGRKSRVSFRFEGDEEEVAATRLGGHALDDVVVALQHLFENEGVPVTERTT